MAEDAVNIASIEAKVAAVLKDIEIVLTDAEAVEGFLPANVKAILADAQAVLSVVSKILADI